MVTQALPAVVFLMGPTGVGKTDLAVDLVARLNCEIISVDSAMVYRGMDIGTAKPDRRTLQVAPHHLIDICDPSEAYSAAKFRNDARAAIDEIIKKRKIPLLVGGTGLYFRALERGLSDLPDGRAELREELKREAGRHGLHTLHRRLAEVDPEAAEKINPTDPQRIIRALEIYAIAGEPMTTLQRRGREGALPYPVAKFVLVPAERGMLAEGLRKRFLKMLELGLVDEVQRLKSRGDLTRDLPSMRLVGYRQIFDYLEGGYGFEQMVEKAIVATRQLAKRQLTWCRSERGAHWMQNAGNPVVDILHHLRR